MSREVAEVVAALIGYNSNGLLATKVVNVLGGYGVSLSAEDIQTGQEVELLTITAVMPG